MKSQTRAWLVLVLLFFLWGTLPASPFTYFANMIRQSGGFLISHPFMPNPWQAILIYMLIGLVLVTLLLLGRSRNRLYIAGICALAEMIHHLLLCIKTMSVNTNSLAIAIGLALALLFLLIKSKSPSLWLSDFFVLSLPVWLIYDGVLYPLSRLLEIKPGQFSPFIAIPANSLIEKLDGVFGLPMSIWALLPLLVAILPLAFLSKNRQKG